MLQVFISSTSGVGPPTAITTKFLCVGNVHLLDKIPYLLILVGLYNYCCFFMFSSKTEGRTIRYVISVVRKDASSLRVSARGRTKAAAKTAAAKAILRKIKKRQL